MPTAKTAKKKTVKKAASEKALDTAIVASSVKGFSLKSLISPSAVKKNKFLYLAAAIIIIALIVSYKKGLLIAATVNGAPITNLEVLQREDAQFHKQTLDQLIQEKLILGEAKKKGVVVTEKEIDAKIAEIEKQVGGAAALDSLLSQQGQTRAGVREQIRISISLEKMYASEATVSADEVSKFIEQNKEQMQSTTEADLTKEATDYLRSQKLNEIFSQKFQEIKKAATIQIF